MELSNIYPDGTEGRELIGGGREDDFGFNSFGEIE
jgi:hypothetical protein